MSNFKPSSKKDLRNVSLVPVGKEKTTMNFLFALMCRCLKLQKSLFLQLLITKFGIMMGTARDETDLFSSISSILINSIWLDWPWFRLDWLWLLALEWALSLISWRENSSSSWIFDDFNIHPEGMPLSESTYS